MSETTVMLASINDVKEFVSIVSLCEYDVDLISGRYAVDAKSIMGIFSLVLSKKKHKDQKCRIFFGAFLFYAFISVK